MIYFDNAATTLIKPDGVYDAVLYGIKNYGNPGRGGHKYSLDAGEAVFQCREKLAELFKISDSENIVFTQNATHSLNIAIRSIVGKGDAVLTTGFEHNSVMRVLFAIGADVRLFGTKLFDSTETVRQLRALINRSIKCVIVNHVSNVFGFIQPVYEISDICKKYGVPLIIDCSQSAGCLDIDQSRLNAAFLCMPGHKGLMGPQGTGVLVCGSADKKPLLFGGNGQCFRAYVYAGLSARPPRSRNAEYARNIWSFKGRRIYFGKRHRKYLQSRESACIIFKTRHWEPYKHQRLFFRI